MKIKADGTGDLTYRTYLVCGRNRAEPCDKLKGNNITPGGHVRFKLVTSTGTTSAQGNITTSNDPQYPVGLALTTAVSGYNLNLSIWPHIPFCAGNTPASNWNCGA